MFLGVKIKVTVSLLAGFADHPTEIFKRPVHDKNICPVNADGFLAHEFQTLDKVRALGKHFRIEFFLFWLGGKLRTGDFSTKK
jgi:hypothetical protein